MTVYLFEGRRSRTEARKASRRCQLQSPHDIVCCRDIPFSINFDALSLPVGSAWKSRLMTRGLTPS